MKVPPVSECTAQGPIVRYVPRRDQVGRRAGPASALLRPAGLLVRLASSACCSSTCWAVLAGKSLSTCSASWPMSASNRVQLRGLSAWETYQTLGNEVVRCQAATQEKCTPFRCI